MPLARRAVVQPPRPLVEDGCRRHWICEGRSRSAHPRPRLHPHPRLRLALTKEARPASADPNAEPLACGAAQPADPCGCYCRVRPSTLGKPCLFGGRTLPQSSLWLGQLIILTLHSPGGARQGGHRDAVCRKRARYGTQGQRGPRGCGRGWPHLGAAPGTPCRRRSLLRATLTEL